MILKKTYTTLPPLNKGVYLEAETYFSFPAISNSDLAKVVSFLSKSPHKALKGSFLEKGTALHENITGVGNSVDINSLSPEDKSYLEIAKDSFWSHPIVKELFQDVQLIIEQGIAVKRKGVLCKCKPDFFSLDKGGILLDIKSTSANSQKEFEKTIEKYKYSRQIAYYTNILKQSFSIIPRQKWIIGVSKKVLKRSNSVRVFPVFLSSKMLGKEEKQIAFLLEQVKKHQLIPQIYHDNK